MRTLFLGFVLMLITGLYAQQKPNILFIAVDDLKPLLGAYGKDFMSTPNIDALAERGIVFTNSHCQQAVCGPSRASIMTGMRPDYTGVWDLKTRMRDVNPDILSMPQYFKQQGYKTVATGKIYDPRCVDKQYDGVSWSIPYSESSIYTYPEEYGEPALSYYALPERKKIVHKLEAEADEKGENRHSYVSKRFKPSTECADVPDDAYMDGQIANNAIKYMTQLDNNKAPFFLAVGFKRPHLPFAAPKKYWDLYKREEVNLAPYQKAVKNGVDMAYHKSGELLSYTDIPPLTSFSDIFTDKIPEDKQRELIHAYYASVSFIDAQVGKILDQLKSKGLDKNTIVVLWGDHGWHLGDHAMWCKHSNFEQATRVPLIMSIPNQLTGEYNHPVELVDVFPSLCEAAGIHIPSHLQGSSLVPVFKNKENIVKEYAVSQFPRGKKMGYSIRSGRYRLTIWPKDAYKTAKVFNAKMIEAAELYDYEKDPNETVNVYNSGKYKNIKEMMMGYFYDFVNLQNQELKSSPAYSRKTASGKAKNKVNVLEAKASDWKLISRNGAEATFNLDKGVYSGEVMNVPEKPWDLGIQFKNKLDLEEGQELIFNLTGRCSKMKVTLGPLDGKYVVKEFNLTGADKRLKLKIPKSGSWGMKVQFLQTGSYRIEGLMPTIK